nr:hypothetical protein [Tanacetum cinerariifolium]GEZ66687.1 hypothetical protein [Tanacetum cinerariifolium]
MENLYLKYGLVSRTYYKSSSSWHQSLASDPNFYDHVSFHLKCEIDCTASGKLRDMNADESWEIIKNLTLYDYEGWNDTKEFVKPGQNKPIKKPEKAEVVEAPSSQLLEYYLKLRITEKLIDGLGDNNRFNDSLSRVRLGKTKGKTYNLLPRGPVYEAILKKKITKKEDIGGNFEIPCNIGGLKHVNALVDQGSDVNVMPYSTYMKLIDESPTETDIRLSQASHSYIYPLGIVEDVLVEAVIKIDKGTVTLRSGKSKTSFHRIPETRCKIKGEVKNNIEPISPTMTVNRVFASVSSSSPLECLAVS